jgi:hypothetical protein
MQQNVNLHSIMKTFADTTGLSNDSHHQRRYLWTDAFAVCNYLELYRQTDKQEYMQLCLKLVDQVHHILGKNRENDAWLSGLDDEQASLHPTLGGLRIGKQLNERQASEPFDDFLEWQRDGQYFHYLTKWMHALNCVSRATGNGIYNQWAIELAQTSHAAFSYRPAAGGVKQMYWKMSTDLSRPLVDSMGQHDPLDGLITYQQLEATAKLFPETSQKSSLKTEIEELLAMCSRRDWATQDPLGIGGLLTDAYRLVQLINTHQLHDTSRLESLLQDIERSLQVFITDNQHNPLNSPAESRLAFRELGLAIGIYAINKMQAAIQAASKQHPEVFTNINQLNSSLTNLSRFYPVYDFIRDFWLEAEHRSVSTWLEHADINNVMLATCLAPDSYLKIE